MKNQLFCGAAAGDITPLAEELDGLEALMRKKFGGILDPLHVRVIALKNGKEQVLFVCFELDKAPYPMEYRKEISEKFRIPEKAIFMLAVHAHAVPITGFMTGRTILTGNQKKWWTGHMLMKNGSMKL